jgi:hypothetical protein
LRIVTPVPMTVPSELIPTPEMTFVREDPSPKNFVAVKIPTCTLVSVAIPGPSIFVNASLGF